MFDKGDPLSKALPLASLLVIQRHVSICGHLPKAHLEMYEAPGFALVASCPEKPRKWMPCWSKTKAPSAVKASGAIGGLPSSKVRTVSPPTFAGLRYPGW